MGWRKTFVISHRIIHHMFIDRISTGLCPPRKWEPFSYYRPILHILQKAEPGMAVVKVYLDVFEDRQTFCLLGQNISNQSCLLFLLYYKKKQLYQLFVFQAHFIKCSFAQYIAELGSLKTIY